MQGTAAAAAAGDNGTTTASTTGGSGSSSTHRRSSSSGGGGGGRSSSLHTFEDSISLLVALSDSPPGNTEWDSPGPVPDHVYQARIMSQLHMQVVRSSYLGKALSGELRCQALTSVLEAEYGMKLPAGVDMELPYAPRGRPVTIRQTQVDTMYMITLTGNHAALLADGMVHSVTRGWEHFSRDDPVAVARELGNKDSLRDGQGRRKLAFGGLHYLIGYSDLFHNMLANFVEHGSCVPLRPDGFSQLKFDQLKSYWDEQFSRATDAISQGMSGLFTIGCMFHEKDACMVGDDCPFRHSDEFGSVVMTQKEQLHSSLLAMKTKGNDMFKLKNFKGAAREYTRALGAADSDSDTAVTVALHSNLSQCMLNLENWAQAAQAAKAALTLDSSHTKSKLRLEKAQQKIQECSVPLRALSAEQKSRAKELKKERKLPKAERQLLCASCNTRIGDKRIECLCRQVTFCSPTCREQGHPGCTGPRSQPEMQRLNGSHVADLQRQMRAMHMQNQTPKPEADEINTMCEETCRAATAASKAQGLTVRQLAEQGHPECSSMHACSLGTRMTLMAGGVTLYGGSLNKSKQRTDEMSLEFHTVAAKAGIKLSMLILGDKIYACNAGVSSWRRAMDWWHAAAELGVKTASIRLYTRNCSLSVDMRAIPRGITNRIDRDPDPSKYVNIPFVCGSPNLASMLRACSPEWCAARGRQEAPLLGAAPDGPLAEVQIILQQIAERYPGCQEAIRGGLYARRGAMGSATAKANQNARKARHIQNVCFTVGCVPSLNDCDERIEDWEFTPPMKIICIHSEARKEDVSDNIGRPCPECLIVAKERLWATMNGVYAVSNTEPLDSQGRLVLYAKQDGSIARDTFKEYSKPEIIAVLVGLTASEHDAVVQPMFIAQDPNLFWPVVSYFGSIRAGFVAARPKTISRPKWQKRVGLPKIKSKRPPASTDDVELNRLSRLSIDFLAHQGQKLYLCGCKGCNSLLPVLKICSKCNTRGYCSPDCQKADWKAHKLECQSS
jgi:hypothetical protein